MNAAFTLVYMFAVRQMFMEMNFPHNGLAFEAATKTASEAVQKGAYRALLAHAIARQSLSFSARNFVASRIESLETLGRIRGQGLDNRIRFFAGQLSPEGESENEGKLFVRGHFRPDIAVQFFTEDRAEPKV